MTCSITWMDWCELWLRTRPNGRKTYTLQRRLRARRCPNITLKLLQRPGFSSFHHISLILAGSCDHLGNGTMRWISVLRTRLLIQPKTRRQFWSIWGSMTVPMIAQCPLLNLKMFRTTTSRPLQRLLDSVNHLLIHKICPAMMKNTWSLQAWLKQPPDKATAQHVCWQFDNHKALLEFTAWIAKEPGAS